MTIIHGVKVALPSRAIKPEPTRLPGGRPGGRAGYGGARPVVGCMTVGLVMRRSVAAPPAGRGPTLACVCLRDASSFTCAAESDSTLDRAIAVGVSDARIVVDEGEPMLENNAMLTRRLLLGSAATLAVTPAVAQSRRGAGQPNQPPAPQDNTPAQTPIGPIATTARWAYIMDYNTGAVLLEKNGDQEMTPSSLTKLMTMYIVFKRLAEGRLKLTDQLPVSATAWRMGGSKMFVRVGTTVSVNDLIRGVIVDSGNDACIVLAQAIAGSQAQFADLMNRTARQLGLTHSHFLNPMGWPVPGHYMSVRDIAVLTADLIRDFPQYYHFFDDKTFTYSNIKQDNRNALVMHGTADGLKTGHTDAGGYGLCASADHNGRRIIVVLNGMPSSRQRAEQGQRLMDWAFANFEDVTLYSAGHVVDHAPVWLGTSATVPLVGGRNLVVTMPRQRRNDAKLKVSYRSPIRAPVAKGAQLGTLTVTGAGVAPMQIPLLAGASVPKLGLAGRALAVLTHYVTGS